jgi:hypothetical protein
MYKRIVIGTLLLLLVASPGLAAPPIQPARSVITSPESNAVLSGVVEVRGFATHPNAKWWYDVSYAAGPEPAGDSQWIPLAQVENTPVENDVLATWDTATVPDGPYTLALTVKGEQDPIYWQYFVTNLTVNNAQPAGAVTPEQATPEPMPTAVAGVTPTPVPIEQPATPTPRPSTVPGDEQGEVGTFPEAVQEERSTGQLGSLLSSAFCSGGVIALMLFLLWGLYVAARILIRWYARQRDGVSSARPGSG